MIEGHKRTSHQHRNDLAGEYRWGDTGQLVFLIVFIIGIATDLLILKISNHWQDIFAWYYRLVIFIPLFFIAVYFAQNAHKKVFDEKREKLMVIKTDVFARIRHPMYFGFIILYLSFVILIFSLISFLIFILIIIFYYYLCRYEERILIEELGDEYKNYKKNVPLLFPKLRL